jgi:IclR family pca regulon transcriptional regulator
MPKASEQTRRVDTDGEWMPSIPPLNELRYSQSLERGLAILGCFMPERPVWGIAELADELGMSRATIHRYALTLTGLGYLRRAARRKYQLSLAVTRLGMEAMSGTALQEHAGPYLQELRDRTGFTVSVGVLEGPQVVLIEWLRGSRRCQHLIDLDLAVGSRLAAQRTAIGKRLLADLPDRVRNEAIRGLASTRDASVRSTPKKALRIELQQLHEGAMAVAEEVLAPGLYEIAAAIRGHSGETTAAVGMTAHSSMIPLGELVDALGPHLVSTADRISARLGYRREDERAGGR